MGTAIRPGMPEKIIEHEPVAPTEPEPQQSVPVDDEDDEPRIHTISPEMRARLREGLE
jgi:hypothetical protein